MRRMAILERTLYIFRRAEARYAGVVRTFVVLEARGAGRGTRARCVVRPFWGAECYAGCGSDHGPWCQTWFCAAGDPDRTPVVPAWYSDGVVGPCGRQPETPDRDA